MLSPRLTDCVVNGSIPATLTKIDERLTYWANRQYNNIIFSMNYDLGCTPIGDLLNYKRILTYKFCNPDYAKRYTVKMIASRVKLLIHK